LFPIGEKSRGEQQPILAAEFDIGIETSDFSFEEVLETISLV
jgi:hypothetical protein